jgi:hypothetical protein
MMLSPTWAFMNEGSNIIFPSSPLFSIFTSMSAAKTAEDTKKLANNVIINEKSLILSSYTICNPQAVRWSKFKWSQPKI